MIPYKEAWDIQNFLFDQNIELKKRASKMGLSESGIQDKLLICEHNPVITLGKSGSLSNLLADENALRNRGVDFFKIDRGGDITFHGPGQLVIYPILDLEHFSTDLSLYLWRLEECIISVLSEYNIDAKRIKGKTGVWLDANHPLKARKICAIGIRTSRYVSKHGLAFNINTDLDFFNLIIPCGISEYSVTKLQKEIGREEKLNVIISGFLTHFERIFEVDLITSTKEKIGEIMATYQNISQA